MRPPLLTGLRTRSAGPNCELLPSPASSLTRSLAALLSLLRSRIPFALGSLRSDPDQLPPDSDALEACCGPEERLLASDDLSKPAGIAGTGGVESSS